VLKSVVKALSSRVGVHSTQEVLTRMDAKQNVYVFDVGNNRAERFTYNGFLCLNGDLLVQLGQINNLRRVDPSGNVFVADFGNDRIEFDGNSKLIRSIILR
jgi:hypothetical protein